MAQIKQHLHCLENDLEDYEVFETIATIEEYNRIAALETEPEDWINTQANDIDNANTKPNRSKRCLITLPTRSRKSRHNGIRRRTQRLKSAATGHTKRLV